MVNPCSSNLGNKPGSGLLCGRGTQPKKAIQHFCCNSASRWQFVSKSRRLRCTACLCGQAKYSVEGTQQKDNNKTINTYIYIYYINTGLWGTICDVFHLHADLCAGEDVPHISTVALEGQSQNCWTLTVECMASMVWDMHVQYNDDEHAPEFAMSSGSADAFASGVCHWLRAVEVLSQSTTLLDSTPTRLVIFGLLFESIPDTPSISLQYHSLSTLWPSSDCSIFELLWILCRFGADADTSEFASWPDLWRPLPFGGQVVSFCFFLRRGID